MGPLLSGLSAFGFLAGLAEDVTTDQSFEVQGWFGKLDLTLRLDHRLFAATTSTTAPKIVSIRFLRIP
ncbi:MAG: hypothetical protein V3R55_05145 [Alphaproteobacteria bacterium]